MMRGARGRGHGVVGGARGGVQGRAAHLLEGDLRVVVDAAAGPLAARKLNARRLELPTLLQRREPPRLLELLLTCLALGLFATCVGKARPSLREHLLLILVHVDRIGARGLALGVRVDLARPEPPRVVRRRRAALLVLASRLVEQTLIVLETLRSGAADDRRDRAPLSRHQLGEVEQLFLLLARPLRFLDRWIEPFMPARLALLCRFAHEQRRDARPLILAVLHDGCLEDLILRVLPHTALDQDTHGASATAAEATSKEHAAEVESDVTQRGSKRTPTPPSAEGTYHRPPAVQKADFSQVQVPRLLRAMARRVGLHVTWKHAAYRFLVGCLLNDYFAISCIFVLFCVLMIAVGALMLWLAQQTWVTLPDGNSSASQADTDTGTAYTRELWHAFGYFIDPGATAELSSSEPVAQRLIACALTVVGLMWTGLAFGLALDQIAVAMQRWRKAHQMIATSGHIVVLGWTEKTLFLIGELAQMLTDGSDVCDALRAASALHLRPANPILLFPASPPTLIFTTGPPPAMPLSNGPSVRLLSRGDRMAATSWCWATRGRATCTTSVRSRIRRGAVSGRACDGASGTASRGRSMTFSASPYPYRAPNHASPLHVFVIAQPSPPASPSHHLWLALRCQVSMARFVVLLGASRDPRIADSLVLTTLCALQCLPSLASVGHASRRPVDVSVAIRRRSNQTGARRSLVVSDDDDVMSVGADEDNGDDDDDDDDASSALDETDGPPAKAPSEAPAAEVGRATDRSVFVLAEISLQQNVAIAEQLGGGHVVPVPTKAIVDQESDTPPTRKQASTQQSMRRALGLASWLATHVLFLCTNSQRHSQSCWLASSPRVGR